MREVRHYNFRALDYKAKEVAFHYKKMKLQLKNKPSSILFLNEGESNIKEDPEEYVSYIDSALKTLNKEERDFIYNEYFNTEGYPFWWLSYYSRSSYYRKKKKALIKFLDLVSL